MAAGTLGELTDACLLIDREPGVSIIVSFYLSEDIMDSSKKIISFDTATPSESKDFYLDGGKRELLTGHLENLFRIAGLSEDFIGYAPDALYDFQKELSALQLEPQDYYNPDKYYNIYSFDELQAGIPNFDLEKLLSVAGFEKPDQVMVWDKAIYEKVGSLYTEENLALFKAEAVKELLSTTAWCLSTDFEKEDASFFQKLYGAEGDKDDPQKALDTVKDAFSEYFSFMYAEEYFTEEAKAEIERMCGEIIGVFKQRISDLSWMSSKTKAKALGKLENLTMHIGYPSKYDTEALDNAVINSFADGGSLLDNVTAIRLEARRVSALGQFLPPDRETFILPAYTVNAFYNPTDNSINFPAGILQSPFFDLDAQAEANYGCIGMVIGHEITHAFDNNGSKYDENGNLSDWWEAEDYNAFEALLADVIDTYDGYETYPGITVNGTQTLGENVADLGGVSALLSVLETYDDPDFDTFFRSFAKVWANVMYRDAMLHEGASNTHSNVKARVNVVLRNMDKFYEMYGINEDDYLFVPPENRVGIW